MKKVLVLMLVLGMASLANAGLVLNINGLPAADMVVPVGTVLNVTIDSDTDSSLSYLDVSIAAPIVIVAGTAAGDMGGVSAPADLGNGLNEYAVTQAFSGAGFSGNVLTAQVTINDTTQLILWDDALGYDVPAMQATITTPEPATMLILGLGGLLLRRK